MSSAMEAIDVEAAVARLKALYVAPPPSRDWRAGRMREDEIWSLKSQLAAEFGRRHGWQPSYGFSLECLARHGERGRDEYGGWNRDAFDHSYYYREGRRAAAIVAHLYPHDWGQRVPKLIAWADRQGLVASVPTDFPSWWMPDETKLVVYTPAIGGGI